MKSEYEFIMTVEIEASTDKEENRVLERFKGELYASYWEMDDEEVMITEIKRV